MKTNIVFISLVRFILSACDSANSETQKKVVKKTRKRPILPVRKSKPVADVATILAKKQVPVLCYHHIREPKPGDGEMSKTYSVSPEHFAEQMKALKDSGYQTILPDELYNYLAYGASSSFKTCNTNF